MTDNAYWRTEAPVDLNDDVPVMRKISNEFYAKTSPQIADSTFQKLMSAFQMRNGAEQLQVE